MKERLRVCFHVSGLPALDGSPFGLSVSVPLAPPWHSLVTTFSANLVVGRPSFSYLSVEDRFTHVVQGVSFQLAVLPVQKMD